MLRHFKYKHILFLFIFALIFNLNSNKISANALSPDKYYIDLKGANQTIEKELTIFGKLDRTSSETVYLYVVGMRKIGEGNEREFYDADPNDKTEPSNWVKLSQTSAVVTPGKDTIIKWSIQSPTVARCGTNLVAIVLSPIPKDNDKENQESNKVIFKQEVVSQIHINVIQNNEGICENMDSDLRLLEYRTNSLIPLFLSVDVPIVTRLENTGNLIARSPKGYIDITGFGGKSTLEFNPEDLDVYQKSIRRFTNQWDIPDFPENADFFTQLFAELRYFRIGQYEARLGITKNIDNPIIATITFWVLPWRTLLVVLLVIIIISILIYRSREQNRELRELRKTNMKRQPLRKDAQKIRYNK